MCKMVGAKVSLCGPGDRMVLLRLSRSIKKGCTLEVRCGGVEFVAADENFFDFVI